MGLRRKPIAPQDPLAVANERIDRLEKQIKQLRQASTTTIQSEPMSRVADPVAFQTLINAEGTHSDATTSDPLVYYHPGDIDKPGGLTSPGFKKVGGVFFPFARAYAWNYTNTMGPTQEDRIFFDKWQTSDPAIFVPLIAAGTPDVMYGIDCMVRGLYAMTVMTDFDPWVGGTTEIMGFSVEDTASTFTSAPVNMQPTSGLAGDNSSGMWSWTHIQSFPPIWHEQTADTLAPDKPSLCFNFYNGRSINVDLFMPMVEVHLLQAYDYEVLPIQSQA